MIEPFKKLFWYTIYTTLTISPLAFSSSYLLQIWTLSKILMELALASSPVAPVACVAFDAIDKAIDVAIDMASERSQATMDLALRIFLNAGGTTIAESSSFGAFCAGSENGSSAGALRGIHTSIPKWIIFLL